MLWLWELLVGYPVGAKIVTNFRQQNICTKQEAERLLCFTNNSGPLFILGTVGISLFGDTTTGIILFVTHLLSCLTVGFLFRFWKCNKNASYNKLDNNVNTSSKKLVCFSNLGEVLSNSINNAISTVVMIGGFVVLFSVIISILRNSHMLDIFCNFINPILNVFNIPKDFSYGIVSGIIELTNGVKSISSVSCKTLSTNIVITAFLLGFGGFSVLLQVWGIISKTDISILPYFIAKFMQGCFASFYTYLVLSNFRFFSLDLNTSFCKNYSLLFLFILLLCLFGLYKFNKKKYFKMSKEH